MSTVGPDPPTPARRPPSPAGVAVPLGGAARAWAARPGSLLPRLHRAAPGSAPSTCTSVDRSRPDPVAGPGHHRELMASVWYPAIARGRRRWRRGCPRGALSRAARVGRVRPRCRGRTRYGGPRRERRRWPGRRPVILFSHGAGGHRFRGHHRGPGTRQPGLRRGRRWTTHVRRVHGSSPTAGSSVAREDVPFTPWDSRRPTSGSSSTASRTSPPAATLDAARRLPAGLGTALDLQRIGMFGWSKGATATALVMNVDRRVRAGPQPRRPDGVAAPAHRDRPAVHADDRGVQPGGRGGRRGVLGPAAAAGGSTRAGRRRSPLLVGVDHQWLIPQPPRPDR